MEFKDLVLCQLKIGKANAISRNSIATNLDVSDRKVRQAIEDLRNDGHFITNAGDGKGYYIAEDIDDIKLYYYTEFNRAMAILKRLKFARKMLKENGIEVR